MNDNCKIKEQANRRDAEDVEIAKIEDSDSQSSILVTAASVPLW
jgi:hypothetical protein